MIISRTPFRISFFGGGTDYPAWFRENGGSVLSTTINKYCHISCRYLPPFFTHKHRIVWSKVETVSELDEIQHPSVRECLRFMEVHEGLEVHHDGDLPARAGLGSSSAFTVGMLNALHTLRARTVNRQQLATQAIHVEQNLIHENVGCQDQVAVAYGGLNRINFQTDGGFNVTPVVPTAERLENLQEHLLLFFTGVSRTASDIAAEKIKSFGSKGAELRDMHQMVDEAITLLNGTGPITEFGRLLNASWQIKRSLTHQISTSHVDSIYDCALKSGAIGGKLLGAGGGGFMLLFAEPDRHEAVKQALGEFLAVPFRFENAGSHILFDESQPGIGAAKIIPRDV